MDSKIANEIFRYDPETGRLYWKIKPRKGVAVGDEIKPQNKVRYIRVGYKGKKYYVHRIIWCMAYGKMPDNQIDHIDQNPKNNRLANLRDVSASSNNRNRSIQANNTSGFVGISFIKRTNKWLARGKLDGISKHLGYFDTKEQAIEARKKFNRECGFHPNHGSKIVL